MPYAQIDVNAPSHPKIHRLSDRAFRIWVTSLCYCQLHLTDGHIPGKVLTQFGVRVTPALVDELLRAGVWEASDGGYQVHDYLAWNASRAEIAKRRAETKARVAKWRAERGGTRPPVTRSDRVSNSTDHANANANAVRTSPKESDLSSGGSGGTPAPEEHPPDGGARLRPETRTQSRDPGPPNPKRIAAIIQDLLKAGPLDEERIRDLPEDTKAKCAQLHVAYDSQSVHQALRGVLAHASRRQA